MMDTCNLRWVSVKITDENREELEALSEFKINADTYMSYGLDSNAYIPSDSILKINEELIPDFSKLPEIRLLISLGMPNREAFKQIYGESE